MANERITFSPVGAPCELPFTGLGYVRVRDALKDVFGPFPIRLSEAKGHGPILHAMGSAVGKDGEMAFVVLADRLAKWGEMELRDG